MCPRTACVFVSMLPFVFFAACGGGGGAPGAANTAPTVVVTAPDADVEMGLTQAGVIRITYRDADPDDTASTDLVADRDGDPATTADQIPIASGRPDQDGLEQTVAWNTAGVPAGSYTILAKTSDAGAAVVGTAPGRVLLNAASSLSITEPSSDISVSRGGLFTVAYTDADPDDVALTWISADRDGDPATTQPGDVTAAPRPELDGAAQELTLSLGAASVGGHFSIFGTTWDGTNLPAMATAPGRVSVRNVAWAKGLGGTAGDSTQSAGVASFPDGSCVSAGRFDGSVTFGAGEPGEVTLTPDETDIFVVRYDPDGTLAWAKKAGGAGNGDNASAVAAFGDGTSLVTGSYRDSATFGAGEANETTLSEATSFFVARYNANGTLAWAQSVGGTGGAIGEALATHADGSFVVSGRMVGTVVFGAGEANETTLTAAGSSLYVARYFANGSLEWATNVDGDSGGFSLPGAVTLFPDGSCAVTGIVGGFTTTTFGPGEATETAVDADVQDAFVARWNADGTFAWVVHIADVGFASGLGVAASPDGSCVAQGLVQDAVVFGAGEPNETSFGAGDGAFLARYRSDGTLAWAKRVEPSTTVALSSSAGRHVAVRSDGAVLASGSFRGLCTFGFGEAAETTLAATHAQGDTYYALFEPDGRLVWVRQLGGWSDPAGIAVNGDGAFFLSGIFRDTIVPGAGDPRETTLTPGGTSDVFVARFNADGGF